MFTAKKDDQIEKANDINKRNALTIALLLLDKEKPTLLDLYENTSVRTFASQEPYLINNSGVLSLSISVT